MKTIATIAIVSLALTSAVQAQDFLQGTLDRSAEAVEQRLQLPIEYRNGDGDRAVQTVNTATDSAFDDESAGGTYVYPFTPQGE